MWTILGPLLFLSPAWSGDLFGMGAFFNAFVNSILILIGGSVTLIFGWKGLRICLSRGLSDAVDEFIVMAAGIAFIVAGPAIASTAIPTVSGLALVPAGMRYCPIQDLGETLGWFLTVSVFLAPGFLLWRWSHGTQGPRPRLDTAGL